MPALQAQVLDVGPGRFRYRRQFLAVGTGGVSGRNSGHQKRQDHASWPAIQDVIT